MILNNNIYVIHLSKNNLRAQIVSSNSVILIFVCSSISDLVNILFKSTFSYSIIEFSQNLNGQLSYLHSHCVPNHVANDRKYNVQQW